MVQIIDDEYDHWEFHNFICLPDYICTQLTFSMGFIGIRFSLFDNPKSESPFPIKSQALVVVDGPNLRLVRLNVYVDSSK